MHESRCLMVILPILIGIFPLVANYALGDALDTALADQSEEAPVIAPIEDVQADVQSKASWSRQVDEVIDSAIELCGQGMVKSVTVEFDDLGTRKEGRIVCFDDDKAQEAEAGTAPTSSL